MNYKINKLPSVSIIIPCHNNSQFLELIFMSLKRQSISPDEIICINDSSNNLEYKNIVSLCRTNDTKFISLPFTDTKIGRRSMARNWGTYAAECDVCLYLDGDMLLGPRYIETIKYLHYLDHKAIIKGVRYSISKSEQIKGHSHCLQIVSENKNSNPIVEDIYRISFENAEQKKSVNISFLPQLLFQYFDIKLTRRFFLISILFFLLSKKEFFANSFNVAYSNNWDFCASNNLSVRKSNIASMGYWDENFTGWGEEDMDFSYRLFRNGSRIIISENGPLYSYHLDHDIDYEKNLKSLLSNSIYFVNKFPEMLKLRKDVYIHYNIYDDISDNIIRKI